MNLYLYLYSQGASANTLGYEHSFPCVLVFVAFPFVLWMFSFSPLLSSPLLSSPLLFSSLRFPSFPFLSLSLFSLLFSSLLFSSPQSPLLSSLWPLLSSPLLLWTILRILRDIESLFITCNYISNDKNIVFTGNEGEVQERLHQIVQLRRATTARAVRWAER